MLYLVQKPGLGIDEYPRLFTQDLIALGEISEPGLGIDEYPRLFTQDLIALGEISEPGLGIEPKTSFLPRMRSAD
jgi:hypothetical protein